MPTIIDRLRMYEATVGAVRARPVSNIDALRAAVAPEWLNLLFASERWPWKQGSPV